MRNVDKILVGKPEGKRPHRRSGHRWEDNIRMNIRETGCDAVDWIHLAQDMDKWWDFVNTVVNPHSILDSEFLD